MNPAIKTPPAVVLVNPQLGDNIGAAARAMANFALADMRLVDPRDGWPNERALKAASGATHIIDNATVHPRLEGAVADCHFVYATTARPRDMIKPVMTPRQAAGDMHARAAAGQRLAIMFGRERWGLENDEVARADVLVMAPVDPSFASLNIAQAVLLMAYEWYEPVASSLGQGTAQAPPLAGPGLTMPDTMPATRADFDGLMTHLEGELESAGFFRSADMRPTMVRSLRNMLSRCALTEQEVRTFRGVIAALARPRPRTGKDGR